MSGYNVTKIALLNIERRSGYVMVRLDMSKGKTHVYKLWLNNYYYIGCSTNLNNRIYSHINIISQINSRSYLNKPTRETYRKFLAVMELSDYVEIKVEILFSSLDRNEAFMYEKDLLHSKDNVCSSYSLNNVKKKYRNEASEVAVNEINSYLSTLC